MNHSLINTCIVFHKNKHILSIYSYIYFNHFCWYCFINYIFLYSDYKREDQTFHLKNTKSYQLAMELKERYFFFRMLDVFFHLTIFLTS